MYKDTNSKHGMENAFQCAMEATVNGVLLSRNLSNINRARDKRGNLE